MTAIIVTVKRVNETRIMDVELSVDVSSEKLAAAIAHSLGWDRDTRGRSITYRLEIHPPGRILRPNETLAEMEAWDGAWIVLHPE